ncbi:palmitoyl-protein thioesterase-like protein 1 [Polychytrium aggregatum]|uniref:palmitoyl-protein thioesterase-like protein 1 n=1 Tax=Polychytrium aggregatum TaxID=110093 RepID=UPI0022FF1D17|nr:palmitoyl-protein thioesterase-like protein 1 [Polychytrium aggregatum]KAI9202002.1 palmitoyl-protein thioesterase-like protein 1 [Polychytrium aggregatum]
MAVLYRFPLVLPSASAAVYTPVVIWHGMGDSCCGGILDLAAQLQERLPGVYVYSVRIGASEDEDRDHGYFDVISRQVDEVCEQLKSDPLLSSGFNAIGFSQGGLLMRAYVEKCDGPAVRNLITMGSPHGGIAHFPGCMGKDTAKCELARSLLLRGAYIPWIQNRVVQAQYYRDPRNIKLYLERNIFLPYVNNELNQNKQYADRLKSLHNLVLVRFEPDDMVVPRDSAWFANLDKDGAVVPLEQQDLWTEDRLGLRFLNDNGRLHFLTAPGPHMNGTADYILNVILEPFLDNELAKDPVLVLQQ